MSPDPDPEPRPDNSQIHVLLLVLLLALASLVQFTVASRTEVYFPLRADAGQYFSYAHNLAHYGVYSATDTWRPGTERARPKPDKARPPGYPLFLLAVGTPEPTNSYFRRVAYVQAFLGVLSILLTYLIASRFVSRTGALIVGGLVVLSPHVMLSSTLILTEGLFTFLLLASVLASFRAVEIRNWRRFMIAGLLWGLCTLVRPTVALFPLLLLSLALLSPKRGEWIRPFGFALLAFGLVLAPWCLRNISIDGGSGLLLTSVAHGSYPHFMVDDRPETWGYPYRFDPAYPAYASTPATLMAELRRKFEREPAKMFRWYILEKPVYLLSLKDLQSIDIQIYPLVSTPYYERRPYAAMRIATVLLHWPLMALGVLGALLALLSPDRLRENSGAQAAAATVALLVVYVVALHMVMAPFPRYAIPFRPLIFALAIFAVERGWRALRRRMRAPA